MAGHVAFPLVPPLKLANLANWWGAMVGGGKELSPGEVAALLHVSPKTVTRWEKTGELMPSQRLPSGYRRYDPADVEALGAILALPIGDARVAALADLRQRNLAKHGRS